MDTPKRMGMAETLAQISQYFALRCRLHEPRELKCAQCGGEIRRVRAYMSLHNEEFADSCVGPGRALRMDIPYCSVCEDLPSRYGCIHLSETELNLPSVLEASRPFGKDRSGLLKQTTGEK